MHMSQFMQDWENVLRSFFFLFEEPSFVQTKNSDDWTGFGLLIITGVELEKCSLGGLL